MAWKGAFIEWREEWSQLLGGCNWYTFHPICIEFEDDRSMGAVEATIIILGLGFRVRWNWRVTPQVAEMMSERDRIIAELDTE